MKASIGIEVDDSWGIFSFVCNECKVQMETTGHLIYHPESFGLINMTKIRCSHAGKNFKHPFANVELKEVKT